MPTTLGDLSKTELSDKIVYRHFLLWVGFAAAQVVEVPDPNLEGALREALNLPAGVQLSIVTI